MVEARGVWQEGRGEWEERGEHGWESSGWRRGGPWSAIDQEAGRGCT